MTPAAPASHKGENMYYIIDRFENDIAVCEDENGKMTQFPRSQLPENVKEGQKLLFENGNFSISDNSETEKRIKSKMDALFGK